LNRLWRNPFKACEGRSNKARVFGRVETLPFRYHQTW
jgi:hypothetical protein